MDNKRFKEEIYNPYQEAWVLVKQLQNMSSTGDHAEWEKWNEETLKFLKKYDDNPFGHAVFRLLTDAGDVIGKMNNE